MVELPPSEFLEARDGCYYVIGTRISLESVAYATRRGRTAAEIRVSFPALASERDLEGVMAYVRNHPQAIDAYLAESEREWEEARSLNPPELVEKMRRYRQATGLKSS
jgi:uncharacterized protein (DUF433 family)